MKYYFENWHHGSSSYEDNFYLDTSLGTYCYVLSTWEHVMRPTEHQVITWEIIYQDAKGEWIENDDEASSIEEAQTKIEQILNDAGYKRIPKKLRVME